MNEDAIIHIAGSTMQIRYRVRQRCMWCGAIIIDEDLERIGFVVDEGETPPVFPTWQPGVMVCMDKDNPKVSRQIPFDPTVENTPPNFCGNLDGDITR